MIASSESSSLDRGDAFPLPVETRYPLELAVRIPELRALYHESNAAIWDVERDLDVAAIDVDAIDATVAAAAALSWSRRAWLSFADISESEAALVRSCLEPGREADFKFVLAARGTERAVATDAAHTIASRFGGYRRRPPGDIDALFNAEPIRRALDARTAFDAYVFAHFVVLATIDRALLEAALDATTEPTCRSALDRMLTDVRRQERVGRIYVGRRSGSWNDALRSAIAINIAEVVNLDVSSGRRCVAFIDPTIPGAAQLVEADAITAAAGLGASAPDQQERSVAGALAELSEEFDDVGIEIPAISIVDRGHRSGNNDR